MLSMKKLDHLRIPLKEIVSATNNFNDGSFIGEGGFGMVYKAEVCHNNDRSIVAIKRLDSASQQGQQEFLTEIAMLSGYKHKNLVSLLGFCDEGGEKILVYQHEVNGSLDKYLRNTNDGYNLTWIQRLNICIGAAHGLDYLHNGVGPQLRIIHRDVKSSNILLDENWEAKVADFGLSKIGPADQQITFLITRFAGTFGYCDPQYFKTGILTKESDVYSFGVVLFEVLCGRLACNIYHDEKQSLARLAKLSYERKNLDEIIDPNIRDQIEAYSLKLFSEIASQCLQEQRQNRPTMTLVVKALENALEIQLQCKRLQALTLVHPYSPHYFFPGIGVYYGNELPLPSEVIRLCKSHNIQQMRLYSPNQALLQSLRGSNIHVMLGVPNSDIQHVASSLDNAQKWMQENVIDYWPDVRFHYIVVGNEDHMDGGIDSQIQYLYRAMANLHEVIELNGLQGPIKVSTAIDDKSLISPSSHDDFLDADKRISSFLVNTDAPLLARVYPYFSYGNTPGVISLPRAPNPIVQGEANEIQSHLVPLRDALYASLEESYRRKLDMTGLYTGSVFWRLVEPGIYRNHFDPLRDALYSSLVKALEAGEGSLDVVGLAIGSDSGVVVEPGVYFTGDKYIFCFFLFFPRYRGANLHCIL